MDTPQNDHEGCLNDTYATKFQRAWDKASTAPIDDRPQTQAWVVATSTWLREAARTLEVGDPSLRMYRSEAVVDIVVDKALRGIQLESDPASLSSFKAFWWQTLRCARTDLFRRESRRFTHECAAGMRRSGLVIDPFLRLDFDDAIERLPDRQKAICQTMLSGQSIAEAIRQVARQFEVSIRTVQRDCQLAFVFLSTIFFLD